ncbi:MAG TPA: BTAD domain-containing putative transcriptional regulator [Gaiellaceae bacterium]|jgi:WD40 repeat protein/DNA-binding SARP family transcriptional activator
MARGRLEFRILGPLTVLADGEPVSVGGPKQRALLALLLLSANRVVSRDRLREELFVDLGPNPADHALRNQISRLRKVLSATGTDPPRLVARPPGYLLRVEPGELDLDEFERLWAEGREALAANRPAEAVRALDAAEALWSGRALADLELAEFGRIEVDRLGELRLAAVELRVDAELALGRHLELVSQLEALSVEYPYRERFRGQLMLALYRSGRQAEGLEVYRRTRTLLTEQLGIEPSVELQELERAILVQEPELQPPAGNGGAMASSSPEALVCPFKGLAPFEPDDHDLFFGRERLVGELMARLESANFLVLTGPSGSGKSSLLRAGLLPSLDGRRVVVRPGLRPAVELARALGDELSVALERLAPGERLVLAIDQFEEAFAGGVDPGERGAFFADLVDASWDPERRAVILLALRADFFGRLASYVELADLVGTNHVLLGPMSPAELRRAIEGPAERVGLSVEPALVDVLVQEVGGAPGGLPLLSAALVDLWRERSGSSLTLEAYERTGGVRGAVARHAEAALGTLGDEEKPIAKRIVLRLVAGGDGEAWTRRRATRAELDADDPRIARVLAALIEMRLLVAGDDSVELVHDALFEQWPRLSEWLAEDAEGRRVHQHLAQAAVSWHEAGRDQSDLYRGTRLAAALEWAEETGSASRVNRLERDFLDESRQASARETEGKRRANRRRRGLLVAALLLLVAAATSGAIVLVERANAQRQATAAVAQRLDVQALDAPSLDTALLLARESVNLEDSSTTQSNLLATLLRGPAVIGVAHSAGGSVLDDALSPNGRLLAFRDNLGTVAFVNTKTMRPVGRQFGEYSTLAQFGAVARPFNALAFSPDGRTLVVGDSSESGQGNKSSDTLVDTHSHLPRGAGGGEVLGATADVLFAPGGRTFVTGEIKSGTGSSPSEVVSLRRATDAKRLTWTPNIPAGRVIGWVDNARQLLVTSGPSHSLLLDARTLRRASTLPEGGAAAVSRNGDLAAFARPDGGVLLVQLRGRRTPERMQGNTGAPIESLAFSPNGEVVASTAADGSVAVWDVTTLALRETLPGHAAPSVDPLFSPDGETLYAGSADGSVIAWDIGGTRTLGRQFRFDPVPAAGEKPEPQPPVVHAAQAVAVSLDGSLFATSPGPGRVTIWRARDETPVDELHGPSGVVKALAFSHDGRRLAAVGTSPNIVVWQLRDRKVQVLHQPGQVFPRALAWAYAVAFSPDDRLVASAGNGGLQVFALRTHRLVGSAQIGGRNTPAEDLVVGGLASATFSSDGRFLAAAAGSNGAIAVWDVRRRRSMRTIPNLVPIESLSFAPHGTTIAVGDASGSVGFWDAATGRQLPERLPGQTGPVLSLSFDPSGRRLMSTSTDGRIRLWDLATRTLIGVPLPGSQGDGWGTFFPNGKRLIAVFGSGAGVIWNVDPSSWSRWACRVARRNLSRTEWHDFLPNLAYRKVCP